MIRKSRRCDMYFLFRVSGNAAPHRLRGSHGVFNLVNPYRFSAHSIVPECFKKPHLFWRRIIVYHFTASCLRKLAGYSLQNNVYDDLDTIITLSNYRAYKTCWQNYERNQQSAIQQEPASKRFEEFPDERLEVAEAERMELGAVELRVTLWRRRGFLRGM